MKKYLSCFLVVAAGIFTVNAQQTTAAVGGEASGAGGTASFTVGLAVYKQISSTGGSVAPGVQQPLQISIITGQHRSDIHAEAKVFPNPVTDALVLHVESESQISYSLVDANGVELTSSTIQKNEEIIPMSSYIPAVYFVKVLDGNEVVKVFRVVKTTDK